MNSELLSEENTETDWRLLLLSPHDNVLVLRGRIEQGEKILVGGHRVLVNAQISTGHKLAARNISVGEKIIKYGAPIGSAIAAINLGDHVHACLYSRIVMIKDTTHDQNTNVVSTKFDIQHLTKRRCCTYHSWSVCHQPEFGR